MTRFALFDRWGNQRRTLAGVTSAAWAEELNGEDTLTIATTDPVSKGDRVVWCDSHGTWHEHTVASVEQVHAEGAVSYVCTCENSVSELYGDFIEDKKPRDATPLGALSSILETSRWRAGSVTVDGTVSTNFYRTSVREALQSLMELCGGELSTTIEVQGAAVTARKVNITRRGTDNGLRFTYGRNMENVRRTFSADDVVTALYGFGKGEETGDGYGRGIDFADLKGGRMYVEDADALELWGRPDGKGGRAHVFGKVEFSDCEDPAELLELTRAELDEMKEPKVSYEADVTLLRGYGYDFSDAALGDDVALVDTAFEPEVRVKGRVTRLERDLLDGGRATSVTVGNIVEGIDAMVAGQYAELQGLKDRSTAWDVAAYTPGAYIQQVMDGLNKQFDAGASYVFQLPDKGIIVASVPLDPETGLPTRTPASAIQLAGGGFRIADSLKGDGSWDWRTFGTGSGFTADLITAGRIVGANLVIDLDTGLVSFNKGSIQSSNGNLDIDVDSGSMSVVNSRDEGVFFKSGSLQLTSRAYFDGNKNAMYGEISRDQSVLSDTEHGVTLEGANGAAIKSSNVSDLSITHFGMLGYMGEGAICAVNESGEAFLGGEKSFSVATSNGQYISSGSNGTVQVGKGLYVWGPITALGEVHCMSNLSVIGNMSVLGEKSAAVATSSGVRNMYAYELAENWFGDLGFSRTGPDCTAVVAIDPLFAETVNIADFEYAVFLTPESNARVWVSEKKKGSFTVESDAPNARFAWEIKARRNGYESTRMELSGLSVTDASDQRPTP